MTQPQDFHESQQHDDVWDGQNRRSHPPAHPEQHQPRGVKFDPTVNLGHILTFVGFMVAIFTAWTTLDKRVTVIEERAAFQAQIDRNQDAKLTESMTSIKEALTDIRSNINRLSDGRRTAP